MNDFDVASPGVATSTAAVASPTLTLTRRTHPVRSSAITAPDSGPAVTRDFRLRLQWSDVAVVLSSAIAATALSTSLSTPGAHAASTVQLVGVLAVLVAGWKEIGLDVDVLPLAGGPWSSAWLANDYEMLMNTFQSGFTSGPANYLTLTPAHSRNILSCGYVDEEVDAWMDEVWATHDDAARVDALRNISRRLAEQAVIFPPVYPKLAMAQRVELSPVDLDRLRISRIEPQHLRFVDP